METDQGDLLKEITSVIEVQKIYKNNIILGDMNSVSPDDNYSDHYPVIAVIK